MTRACDRARVGLTALIYLQILIGATMRHLGAGLAIPDFPLAFGHLVPPTWSTQIAVHFTHRVVALVVIAGDPRERRVDPRPVPRPA